ncbi:CPBP family intramembrane metalloprotease [Flavihumibacter rivuli]|uniref:CPBP family intramembrane glutamic endopeptidase n=1 Tax=Flavihumibacter rivuli TaxID=2838156 RepID=UPI001BDF1D13|nr:CPBP family intramembrane glutamic endopeptidase [Flavihumibacter rivuli]ULQ56118.1 CPBP family intramembrane metalloprotease [Flavihumibacter rivuli]
MNSTYLKYKPAWLQLFIFGSLTFGIYLVLGFVAFYGVAQYFNLPVQQLTELSFDKPGVLPAMKLLQGLLSVVIFLLPALVFAYLSDPRPLPYVGLRKPIPPVFYVLGVILLIGAFPVASWLSYLNQHLHLPASMKSTEDAMKLAEENANKLLKAMLAMKGTGDLVAMIFLLAVLPAVCEELFFRGVLQRLFIQITTRPLVGVIITAALFSAFHGQFYGFLPRLMLGVLLGLLYWYSGSIWPSIIGHFLNNALQIFMVYKNPAFADQEPNLSPGWVFVSLALIAAVIWYSIRISHTHYGEVYDNDEELFMPTDNDTKPL